MITPFFPRSVYFLFPFKNGASFEGNPDFTLRNQSDFPPPVTLSQDADDEVFFSSSVKETFSSFSFQNTVTRIL